MIQRMKERAKATQDQDRPFWLQLAKAWSKRDHRQVLTLCRVIRGIVGEDELVAEIMGQAQVPLLQLREVPPHEPGVCPFTRKRILRYGCLEPHEVCKLLGTTRVPRAHMEAHGYVLRTTITGTGYRRRMWVRNGLIERGLHCECLTERPR